MKSILFILILLLPLCISGSSADVARFTASKKESEKIRHEARTGVFVRYEVDGQIKELEIFITHRRKASELTRLLRSQGFKDKGEGERKVIDKLESRFVKAFNPLNPSAIVVMETP